MNVFSGLDSVEVWRNEVWELCQPLHCARHEFAVGVAVNRIYAVGGFITPHPTKHLSLEIYNPDRESWEIRRTERARGGSDFGIAVVNEKIYGFDGGQKPRQTTYFDPVRNTMQNWRIKIASFPDHVHSFDVAALNGMVYLVGQTGTANYFASFNTETFVWKTLPNKPLGQGRDLAKIAIIRHVFEN